MQVTKCGKRGSRMEFNPLTHGWATTQPSLTGLYIDSIHAVLNGPDPGLCQGSFALLHYCTLHCSKLAQLTMGGILSVQGNSWVMFSGCSTSCPDTHSTGSQFRGCNWDSGGNQSVPASRSFPAIRMSLGIAPTLFFA